MATKQKRPLVPEAPVSVFADGGVEVWTTYAVQLSFTGKLFGGSPFDPELVEGWLRSKLGITDEEELRAWMRKHIAETEGLDPSNVTDEEIAAAIEQNAAEKKAQGFKRTPNENAPYIEGRHVKAMIKEATNIAFPQGEHKWGRYKNTTGKEVGGKSPLSYVAERVWVPEVPIVVAEESDGYEFAVGHIDDWRGRRSTIGYFEYCEKPVLNFEVNVLDDCLSHEQWARIWQVAEGNGLGARRSQGGGQFAVTAWSQK
jgi:hypothetical protein